VDILFLTTVLPTERLTGSEVVSDAFVRALRADGHGVTVLGYRRRGCAPPLHRDDVAVADRHIETRGAGARPGLWMARAIFQRQPYSAVKYASRPYRSAASKRHRHSGRTLVVIDHAQMGWVVPATGWSVPHAYLAHNVEHRLYAQLAEKGGVYTWLHRRESARILRAEVRLCRTAAAVWSLTAKDAAALTQLGGAPARAFDTPATVVPPDPGPAHCDVALLGSWTWEANAAGLRWFLDSVLPRLAPGLDVRVAGAGAEEVVGPRDGVSARGRVPDAMGFLQTARVIAVPATAGTGVQVKTLDAIACGRPVVVTPMGMRGIADPPEGVSVAADPEAFASALQEAVDAPGLDHVRTDGREWAQRRATRFDEQVHDALLDLGGPGS